MEAVAKTFRIRNLNAISASLSLLTAIGCGFSIYITTDKTQLLLLALLIFLSSWNVIACVGEMAKARASLKGLPPRTKVQTAEDRLDELERLKRRDMVTPEEYAAKRQDILKDL